MRSLAHELLQSSRTAVGYWIERAFSQRLPFERMGFKYSNGLLTPKDYASHFKNILHHRLLLRSVKPSNGTSRCRCCHRYTEDTRHLAACKVLRQVWLHFNRLVAATHRQMKLTPELVFHGIATDNSELPPGLIALHLVLWKLVIFHFTLVETDNNKFNPDRVWGVSLRRFEVRVNALAAQVTRRAVKRRGQGHELLQPNAENRRLAPLASLDSWGRLTLSQGLTKAFADSRPTAPTPTAG